MSAAFTVVVLETSRDRQLRLARIGRGVALQIWARRDGGWAAHRAPIMIQIAELRSVAAVLVRMAAEIEKGLI